VRYARWTLDCLAAGWLVVKDMKDGKLYNILIKDCIPKLGKELSSQVH